MIEAVQDPAHLLRRVELQPVAGPDLEAVHREWLAQRAEEGAAAPGRSG